MADSPLVLALAFDWLPSPRHRSRQVSTGDNDANRSVQARREADATRWLVKARRTQSNEERHRNTPTGHTGSWVYYTEPNTQPAFVLQGFEEAEFHEIVSLGFHENGTSNEDLAHELSATLADDLGRQGIQGVVLTLPPQSEFLPAMIAAGFRVLGERKPSRSGAVRINPVWRPDKVLGIKLAPAIIMERPNPQHASPDSGSRPVRCPGSLPHQSRRTCFHRQG